MPDVAEYWLGDLRGFPDMPGLVCPQCGGIKWTVRPREYGLELACWACPTYIGVRPADV